MKFSILIPSRNRPEQLMNLLQSFIDTTAYIEEIEFLVAVDQDDQQLQEYQAVKILMGEYNFRLLTGPRKQLHPNYYNDLAIVSSGEILWALCDDCIIDTKKWDAVAVERILNWQHSRRHMGLNAMIWYGDVGDSTRNFNNNGQYSCFPMLPRTAFDTIGYFFNAKNETHGTDKFLKHIFEQSGAGVIDLSAVMVKHHHVLSDSTSKELYEKFAKNVGQEWHVDYTVEIDRLRKVKTL